MAYIDPVKWPEVEQLIRTQMQAQPRGYQARLAEKIGKTPAYTNQIIAARRPIPLEHLDAILESLGLEYDVVVKAKSNDDNPTS